MAYLPTSQRTSIAQAQDPNQVQQSTAMPTSSAGGGTAPSPVYGSASSAPVGSTTAQNAPSYPLVTDYLRANEGAGNKLASTISSQVGGEVESAKQAADRAQSEWAAQNQNTINQWQQAVTAGHQTDAQRIKELKQKADEQLRSINGFWFNPPKDDLNAYVRGTYDRYRSQYAPTAVADPNLSTYYTPQAVTAAQADVNDTLNALGSEGGRSAIVSSRFGGRGGYGGGAAALDSALLNRANPQSDIRARYGNIINALTAEPAPIAARAPAAPAELSARWWLPSAENPSGLYPDDGTPLPNA